MITKKCGKCKKIKKSSEFYNSKGMKKGLHCWCKKCHNADSNKRYYDNIEKYRVYKKKQNRTPKGRFRSYRGVARRDGKTFTLTFSQFMTLWKKPCFYCNQSINTIGLDRKDNTKGYTINNVIPCCWVHNRMKFDMTQKKFLERCKQVVSTLEIK